MPTIIVRHPDGSTQEREVTGRLTVGCDEDNDLVLRAGGVSQRHAQFFADGGELVLENVGSAAATLVDGETLTAPKKLKPGVRVLIGEYEVSLKPDRVSVRKLPAVAVKPELTQIGPPPRSRSPRLDPATRPRAAPLFALGLGVVAIFGVLAWGLMPGQPAVVELPLETATVPCMNLEPKLRIAREEPSERSLAAAKAVLECDPLNPEMLAVMRQTTQELKGADASDRAVKLVELGRDEQAFEAFREIPRDTKAFVSGRPAAISTADRIQRSTRRDCLVYAKEKKWIQAQPVCERASEILCQGLSGDALYKPKEPALLAAIKARETNDPSGAKWKCPVIPIIQVAVAGPPPGKVLHAELVERLQDPALIAAVDTYAEGKLNEAIVMLQVVKEKSSKASLHAQAEALRKDMANVDSLKKIGDGMLKKGELEKAAKTYREALEFDARVIVEHERFPSVTRRTIREELSAAALLAGNRFAVRPDLQKACAAYKLGFSFSKGNVALNGALMEQCSTPAQALLDSARSCADLDRALELAVPNDGIAERIAAQRPQLNCP